MVQRMPRSVRSCVPPVRARTPLLPPHMENKSYPFAHCSPPFPPDRIGHLCIQEGLPDHPLQNAAFLSEGVSSFLFPAQTDHGSKEGTLKLGIEAQVYNASPWDVKQDIRSSRSSPVI